MIICFLQFEGDQKLEKRAKLKNGHASSNSTKKKDLLKFNIFIF